MEVEYDEGPFVIYCDQCEEQITGTQYYTSEEAIICHECLEDIPGDGPEEEIEEEESEDEMQDDDDVDALANTMQELTTS